MSNGYACFTAVVSTTAYRLYVKNTWGTGSRDIPEAISDIATIRAGAAAGATALQPPTRTNITLNESDSITLADNAEYILNGAGCDSVDFEFPSGAFECYIRLTTKSSGTTVSFPAGTTYIGAVPQFGNGETWEISVKDGIVVAGKVVIADDE